jgi:hypothetical protein
VLIVDVHTTPLLNRYGKAVLQLGLLCTVALWPTSMISWFW